MRSSSRTLLCLALAACGGGAPAAESVAYTSAGSVGGEAEASYGVAEEAMSERAPMSAPSGAASGGFAADEAMAPPPAPATARAAMDGAPATSMTVTVDAPVLDYVPEPVVVQQQVQAARLLTAASVGDHDRRGNYLDYVRRHLLEQQQLQLDMSRRMRIRVLDTQGQPINDASIVVDGRGQGNGGTVEGRTHADGGWDFFPSLHQMSGEAFVIVTTNGRRVRQQVFLNGAGDSQDIEFRIPVQHQAPRALDLAFVIDVTGSMEDELRYVNREVTDIVARIHGESPEVSIRVGAVFYRDRTDAQPLQRIQFTDDIGGFANAMTTVHASGGGDYPEDLNAGLQTAIDGLSWREGNAVRVLCVIADAPPKHYATQFTYHSAMVAAARGGIRILPVAASGADRTVEYLFRAMGTFTSAPYVYLTDDSGVGNPHMEADTDRVAVEYFHDLLSRVVASDLHGLGMHEPTGFDR